jgi:hypothetical protein
MLKHCIIVAIALVAFVARASADDNLTVQNLYSYCQAPEASTERAICIGYIAGVGNVMQMAGALEQVHHDVPYLAVAICGDITTAAMVQAFKNWAKKNPAKWTKHQMLGVTEALFETWHCPFE